MRREKESYPVTDSSSDIYDDGNIPDIDLPWDEYSDDYFNYYFTELSETPRLSKDESGWD